MPPKKCKDEEVERKLHGVWRNVVAIQNPRTKKWDTVLIPFKMLIYFMMTFKNVVPLGFMYKQFHGCFLPVGEKAAAFLKKMKWPKLISRNGEDPVPRKKGLFLGDVVADAFVTLCQWKWFGGFEGLFSRIICACMDPANRDRDFAATVFGGTWFIGELAGRITWDPLPCLQALCEKSHADYFGVLGSLIAEMLSIYDTRQCGRLLEMKNRFCDDNGLIQSLYINLCNTNHRTFTSLIDRFLAHGGGLTLAVTQMFFWGDGLVKAIQMFTYYNNGEPLLVVDEEPRPRQYPGHTYVVKRGTRRQKPPRGATIATAPPETTYILYSKNNRGDWTLVKGIKKTQPTTALNVETLMACAGNPKNEWGIIDQGTLEQMDARAPRQLQELWKACGTKPTSLLSMEEGNSIVNGETRIVHNKGGREVARLLRATGRKMVSECKEEGEVELSDGRTITYSTATSSYDARQGVRLTVCIDAAEGLEPLLNRQVGAIVIAFDFTGTSTVTYVRGGQGKALSLPPPKDNFLFCPLPTTLSKASLDCLAEGITCPKNALMLGLAREHGVDLGDDWLAKNPLHGGWGGTAELYNAICANICGPRKLRETVLKIMEPHANWLLAASPCACTVEELVRALAADGKCSPALLKRVRGALSGRVVEAVPAPAALPAAAFDSFGDGDDPFGALSAVAAAVPSKPAARRKKPAARRPPAASSVQAPAAARPRRRAAPAPAPAPAAVRDAFKASARRVLKAAPLILEDLVEMASAEDPGLVELAGHAQRAAGHAQRMIDELDALQLSVGTRGRPVPSRATFDRDDASSAASPTAPPSGNPAPRRRPKTRSTETAGDDVDMEGL